MRVTSFGSLGVTIVVASVTIVAACNAVIGLDRLEVEEDAGGQDDAGAGDGAVVAPECTSNRECSDDAGEPAVCLKPEGRCVALSNEQCRTVTGDHRNDNAVVIGSLFTTSGAQAAINLARQQSATLAVEQINAAGGVPAGSSAAARPLVMVSCDATELLPAARHLAEELRVPAIVGPNTSQDTLDVSTQVTIPAGTLVMTPSGIASDIASLIDEDLTWLMVASDVQRAPLMIHQINALEQQLREERERDEVKLGIIFRNDALGVGTRTSMNGLVLNGEPLSAPVNLGNNIQIDPYEPAVMDRAELIQKYVEFAPDIVVLAGTAEAITTVMVPLEEGWADNQRPHYVLVDPLKTPELLAAAQNTDLRHRVRGTGATPSPEAQPVYDAFRVDYQVRYPGTPSTFSGMGPAYDATYAIAFALAATSDLPVSGANLARGLRKIGAGATRIEIGATKARAAFQRLAAGEEITAIGTFAPLRWDENGALVSNTLEIWCIGASSGTPSYESSGLTYDLTTGQVAGEYRPCEP